MSESSRKALLDFWEWLGGPPGCPGVVGRPFRMPGSGREDLPDIQEWSGGSSGCPRVVGRPSRVVKRPSRMSCSRVEALQNVLQ